ncbi:sensor histidine kinase [Enterococcus saccharolyticus]|uniref:sensor histidine kinase n=1 Tax=Enterococcus saccharolyticus TaxID=41997 RepID=UPI001E346148|nr:sensor histidine kinase [Enterococcus saccharolyticus]MCD5003088.1 sensor histidine kinase [Enterococcus saccharolyticus]
MKVKLRLFQKYLLNRKIVLSLFLFFALVNLVVGYVYQLPVERALLSIAISGFVVLIVGAIDFIRFYEKHRLLTHLRQRVVIGSMELPETNQLIEEEYQKIIQEMQEELLKLENTFEQSEQEILDYFTTWVHQIKVPIAALHLILQTEDSDLSDEISEQLFHIDQYVNLILQYVRLGSSSTDYVFQETSLDELVRENIKKYAPSFIRKNLALHYEPITLTVLTDPKWLSFVIDQLLSNAVKYTNQGAVSIYLEDWQLVIEDTGIGILPEDLPRIGERNFTGFTGRQQKTATGIGLYLSKQIIEKLGHRISVSSVPNKGTKVMIQFSTEQLKLL